MTPKFARFIHLDTCRIIHSWLLMQTLPSCEYSINCLSSPLLVGSWIFAVWAITNGAAMNILAHGFWCTHMCVSVVQFLRMGLLSSWSPPTPDGYVTASQCGFNSHTLLDYMRSSTSSYVFNGQLDIPLNKGHTQVFCPFSPHWLPVFYMDL